MINTEPQAYFQQLDSGTLFTTQQIWEHTDETTGQKQIRECVGTWPWSMVWSVQTMSEHMMPEVQQPRCVIQLAGDYLYLRANYQTVQKAWREYRQRYEQKFQFTNPN